MENKTAVIHFDDMHSGPNEKGKYTTHKRYFLTINNPLPIFSHEYIKEMLSHLNLKYWAICDERGLTEDSEKEGNFHTHIYWESYNVIRWDTVKRMFHTANIQPAFGTNTQCRNYLLKVEDYAHKAETSIENSFEEWGEFIPMQQGKRTDWAIAREMFEDGNDVYDVIKVVPHLANNDTGLGRLREMIIGEQYIDVERELEVVYIQGKTGWGKSRYVISQHGHKNMCRITDYKHGCFNKYKCEDVMVFEEYAGQFSMTEILNFLDRYPLELPCKYYNKIACYTKVYIIGNLRLEEQYTDVKKKNRDVYDAWIRRINKVMVFTGLGEYETYSTQEYLQMIEQSKVTAFVNENKDLDFDDIEDIA